MKKSTLFALAAAVQILATLSIAARYEFIERTGETLTIRAYGYDPTDLFRGDYVNLTYGDLATWSGTLDFEPAIGSKVYVLPTVSQTGEIVSLRGIFKDAPENARYLSARVSSRNFESPTYSFASALTSSSMPLSGNFVSKNEYPYFDSEEAGKPKTNLSVGDSAWAAVSRSGSVLALYKNVKDCAYELRYADYAKNLDNFPDVPADAKYDEFSEALLEYCRAFPKVDITAVSVPRVLRFDYGADRLFVEQKTGTSLEIALRDRTAYAIWKVSPSGKIVLHGVRVDDIVYE